MHIDQIIDAAIAIEGGYSDHPADRGGPTRWGITEKVARRSGYDGDMRHLPRSRAATIYKARYWTGPGLDQIHSIAPDLAAELFDTGINMGPRTAVGFLQRALNVLNREGKDYGEIAVDKIIGPQTLTTLRKFMARRGKEGESILIRAVEALQGARYIRLAEQRPANEAFLYGWLSKRIT